MDDSGWNIEPIDYRPEPFKDWLWEALRWLVARLPKRFIEPCYMRVIVECPNDVDDNWVAGALEVLEAWENKPHLPYDDDPIWNESIANSIDKLQALADKAKKGRTAKLR